jgi:hypothetical protein
LLDENPRSEAALANVLDTSAPSAATGGIEQTDATRWRLSRPQVTTAAWILSR